MLTEMASLCYFVFVVVYFIFFLFEKVTKQQEEKEIDSQR